MTEVKMPEPVYFTTKNGRLWTFPDEVDQTGLELRIYTELQMKQYGDDRAREALEMAAKLFEPVVTPASGFRAKTIRALAKEIK